MTVDSLIPLLRRSIAPARASLLTAELLPKIEGASLKAAADQLDRLSGGLAGLSEKLFRSGGAEQAERGVLFLDMSRDLARSEGALRSAGAGARVTVNDLWLVDAVDAELFKLQRLLS